MFDSHIARQALRRHAAGRPRSSQPSVSLSARWSSPPSHHGRRGPRRPGQRRRLEDGQLLQPRRTGSPDERLPRVRHDRGEHRGHRKRRSGQRSLLPLSGAPISEPNRCIFSGTGTTVLYASTVWYEIHPPWKGLLTLTVNSATSGFRPVVGVTRYDPAIRPFRRTRSQARASRLPSPSATLQARTG